MSTDREESTVDHQASPGLLLLSELMTADEFQRDL